MNPFSRAKHQRNPVTSKLCGMYLADETWVVSCPSIVMYLASPISTDTKGISPFQKLIRKPSQFWTCFRTISYRSCYLFLFSETFDHRFSNLLQWRQPFARRKIRKDSHDHHLTTKSVSSVYKRTTDPLILKPICTFQKTRLLPSSNASKGQSGISRIWTLCTDHQRTNWRDARFRLDCGHYRDPSRRTKPCSHVETQGPRVFRC